MDAIKRKALGIVLVITTPIWNALMKIVARFVRVRPNRVIANAYYGRQYSDNTRFIVEALLDENPDLEIVWIQQDGYSFELPKGIQCFRCKNRNKFRYAIEYMKSAVWIDTHLVPLFVIKNDKQMFIETWHGGLGIKKLDMDSPEYQTNIYLKRRDKKTSDLADVFISNSNHLSRIYKSAFGYSGPIVKCGYPKNDIMLDTSRHLTIRQKVREHFHLNQDDKIVLIAPTHRDDYRDNAEALKSICGLPLEQIEQGLKQRFGGRWISMVRLHPSVTAPVQDVYDFTKHTVDAGKYPDMQDLIIACDAFITDYSSGIFDAALIEKPGFIYASDYDDYIKTRGVYVTFEELPFPSTKTADELMYEIAEFDEQKYSRKWKEFAKSQGLYESGHAAKDIAKIISQFCKIGKKPDFEAIAREYDHAD